MIDDVSEKRPWAIILCRFKGLAPDPALEDPIKKFYNEAFSPGSGGLIEYWRDVSLGAIDIRGSKVFDWVELEITRAEAGGPGAGRLRLTNYAISAAQRKGLDPITGFLIKQPFLPKTGQLITYQGELRQLLIGTIMILAAFTGLMEVRMGIQGKLL